MKRATAIGLVLALCLASCGGDAEPMTTTTTTSTTVAASTASPETTTRAPETTTSSPTVAPTTPTTVPVETTTTTEEPDDGVVSIIIEVVGGEVVGGMQTFDIDRDATVEITVAADVSDEVHVHGYDELGDVAPDEPVTLSFVADIPGIFEVELEGSGLELAELRVS